MSPREIKDLRENLGLSESDIGAIFELSQGELEKIENGVRPPSKTMLSMLSLFKGLNQVDARELALRLRDAALAARGPGKP